MCPTSDPSPCKNQRYKRICGHGGIGRLGGFRFHCESVQVRVLLPAPKQRHPEGCLLFLISIRRTRTHLNGTVRWTVACRRSRRRQHHNFLSRRERKCKSSPVARTNQKSTPSGVLQCVEKPYGAVAPKAPSDEGAVA